MKKAILLLAFLVGGMVGCAQATQSPATQNPHPGVEDVTVEQFASYAFLTREQMTNEAEAIFTGRVMSVSPTRWNQDSGEPWSGGLLIYQVEMEVDQAIVDVIGLDKRVTLTILGNSPLDGRADHDLKVGDQGVFFVRKTELDWQGGTRPIIQLLGVPSNSYFLSDASGLYTGALLDKPTSLTDIISQIASQRPTLVQP